jgi:hypothetical protein
MRWVTYIHQPLHTRIPVLDELDLPGCVWRLVDLEEHAFWLCADAVVGGFEGGEECGDVGGVEMEGYVEGDAGGGAGVRRHGRGAEGRWSGRCALLIWCRV